MKSILLSTFLFLLSTHNTNAQTDDTLRIVLGVGIDSTDFFESSFVKKPNFRNLEFTRNKYRSHGCTRGKTTEFKNDSLGIRVLYRSNGRPFPVSLFTRKKYKSVVITGNAATIDGLVLQKSTREQVLEKYSTETITYSDYDGDVYINKTQFSFSENILTEVCLHKNP